MEITKKHIGQLFSYFLNKRFLLKAMKNSIIKASNENINTHITYETKKNNLRLFFFSSIRIFAYYPIF